LSVTNPKRENKGRKIVFIDHEDYNFAEYREHHHISGQASGPQEHTGRQQWKPLKKNLNSIDRAPE